MNNKAAILQAALASRQNPASSKPSAGLSKSAKSSAVKSAKKGKDFGKKNVPGKSGFGAVEENAEKEGKSPAAAQKIAGAVFWKKVKRG